MTERARLGCATGALTPRAGRLALGTIATGAALQRGGETYFLQIDEAAAALSLLNSGAPFLLEHRAYIDDLLGDVREAWIADGRLYSIVRFIGGSPAADRVWTLVEADYRLGASLGYEIIDAEPIAGAPNTYQVTRWRATEISACVLVGGADPRAALTWKPFAELCAVAERQREVRLEVERGRRLAALKADRWRHWAANGAATALAEAVGVPEHTLAPPLVAAVERHLDDLAEAIEERPS